MLEDISFVISANPGEMVGDCRVVALESPLLNMSEREQELIKRLVEACKGLNPCYALQRSSSGLHTIAFLQALEPYVPDSAQEWFYDFRDQVIHYAGLYDHNEKKIMPEQPLPALKPKIPWENITLRVGELLGVSQEEANQLLARVLNLTSDPDIEAELPKGGGLYLSYEVVGNRELFENELREIAKVERELARENPMRGLQKATIFHPMSFLVVYKLNGETKPASITPITHVDRVPYSEHPLLTQTLEKVVLNLKRAMKATEHPGLREYLWAVMYEISTSTWGFGSERCYLDLNGLDIMVSIGAIETYTDRLLGVRRDFQGVVSIVDHGATEKLRILQQRSLKLEQLLPCAPEYKHSQPPQAGNIIISNAVYLGGAPRFGTVLLGHSLPNSPEVQAIGSIKNIFANLNRAKFEAVVAPIVELLFGEEVPQTGNSPYWEAFLMYVIGHEASHPFLELGGAREALGEHFSNLEEPKADTAAIYLMPKYHEMGLVSQPAMRVYKKVYIATLVRTIRNHLHDPHGIGARIQFNYLLTHGGINIKENSMLEITPKFNEVLEDLLREICTIEASKNLERAVQLEERYGGVTQYMQHKLTEIEQAGVPRDIVPKFFLNFSDY
ncbi:hypothetical protein DRJ48_04870 [Candidatus Woesearchaeota archaeon]|nr:MAG: hypothetical protein DRJ48_04870 [Candidatus Woesearchaeota archaeon]